METLQMTATLVDTDIRAAQRGDRQAFARLVESTCTLVSSIAIAIARDPDLSRDIAQDVFLSAWRDIGKLREPSSFLPWLRQITRHRAYHVLRTARRRHRRVEDHAADELLAAVVDPRPDVAEQLIATETRRVLAATIDLLPDDAREVVTLYYREGQSATQVAELLGLSEAAVRQRLSRARARLHTELLERLGQELVETAPGATFVASVTAALTVAAPSASAAATVAAAGAKDVGLLAKNAAFLGGAALGAAGGIAGVVFGLRSLRREARDDQERDELDRLQRVAIAVVIAAALGMPLTWELTHSRFAPVLVFVAFVVSLGAIYEVWLPRILRRRFAAEMREDPERATARRSRERRLKIVGWTVGLLSGTAGLVVGLFSGL